MTRKSFMSVMNVNVKIIELDVCTASSGTEGSAALRVVLRHAQDEGEDDTALKSLLSQSPGRPGISPWFAACGLAAWLVGVGARGAEDTRMHR